MGNPYRRVPEELKEKIFDDLRKNVVGYKVGFHHEKELVIETLRDAIHKSQTIPKILHSDQGGEYRSYEYFVF